MTEYTAIDLFCGAGGLSEGFRQAGFHVVAGNDYDEVAGATFASTHKEARFLGGAIEKIPAQDFILAGGIASGELTAIVGGPPCQGFSVNNHHRGMHDVRSSLYKEYLRLVDGLRPQWVVLENVTGMVSAGQGEAVLAILSGLSDLGYNVETRILKAEQYGIAQERRRLVFIGNRVGLPIVWPEPTHGLSKPFVTVQDAIGDLPEIANGEDRGAMSYRTAPKSEFQSYIRDGSKVVTCHGATRLADINIKRMRHIPQGGSWRDIPFELLPSGMQRAKRSDHTKRYGRLRWDGLASTILTKCDPHWGAYFHPDQDRAITVREAARFQSFPDWFEFQGSKTDQFVQVGNAVPPLLGRQIAEALKSSMSQKSSDKLLIAAE
jgi:DNA (cytosine-5)-methyltransferase 1